MAHGLRCHLRQEESPAHPPAPVIASNGYTSWEPPAMPVSKDLPSSALYPNSFHGPSTGRPVPPSLSSLAPLPTSESTWRLHLTADFPSRLYVVACASAVYPCRLGVVSSANPSTSEPTRHRRWLCLRRLAEPTWLRRCFHLPDLPAARRRYRWLEPPARRHRRHVYWLCEQVPVVAPIDPAHLSLARPLVVQAGSSMHPPARLAGLSSMRQPVQRIGSLACPRHCETARCCVIRRC